MSMLSANDRFEILDLCSRYNNFLDRGDTENLMECWTKNAFTFDSPWGKFTNWEKLRQFMSKEMHGGKLAGKRHVLFNVVVREGDDVDTAFVDAEYLVIDKDHLELISSGSFKSDKVQRISMGWKFVARSQKDDVLLPPSKSSASQIQADSQHH